MLFLSRHRHALQFSLAIFIILSSISLIKSMFSGNVIASEKIKSGLANIIYLDTSDGCRITIETMPNVAPNHVKRIKQLCKEKFYDGLNFHRVIDGFMAQAGGKDGDNNYGSGKKLKAEFSNVKHVRGIVSMARAQDPNSADGQFFIVTSDSPFLDKQYTVWGRVIDGMECVDKIKKGPEYANGMVTNPTKIKSMRLALEAEIEKVKAEKSVK